MDKVYLNKELSEELHNAGNYMPKHCYDNVFENIGSVGFRFKEENIKVMFCYVSVGNLENVYTRHACFYLDGMAVDPTIVSVYKEKFEEQNIEYIPFRIMTIDAYFKLLSRENNTDLIKTFSKVEKLKQDELRKNGIVLIG